MPRAISGAARRAPRRSRRGFARRPTNSTIAAASRGPASISSPPTTASPSPTRLLQRQAQRGERRGQQATALRQPLMELRRRGTDRRRRGQRAARAPDAQYPGDAAARAGDADGAGRRRIRPHARTATTTPIARTTRSAGSTGRSTQKHAARVDFFRKLTYLRNTYPMLRRSRFFTGAVNPDIDVKDVDLDQTPTARR